MLFLATSQFKFLTAKHFLIDINETKYGKLIYFDKVLFYYFVNVLASAVHILKLERYRED